MKVFRFGMAVGVLSLLQSGFGAELHVPRDHESIQAAVDAATSGMRIVVSAGTYKEHVVLKPGVVLVSEGDQARGETGLVRAERTVIDGAGAGDSPGVAMAEGAVLDGFTVTGVGSHDEALWERHWEERGENQDHALIGQFGAPGIGIDGVSCRVRNCIVRHNGHTGIAVRGWRGIRPSYLFSPASFYIIEATKMSMS